MTVYQEQQTAEERLAAIRTLARALLDSSDAGVWGLAVAIDQLCLGSISTEQARAQLED